MLSVEYGPAKGEIRCIDLFSEVMGHNWWRPLLS